jgi:hypothetical protein
MSKTSQINIRFDAPTEAALNEICSDLGISKSALVRRLTEKFIMEVKRSGGVKIAGMDSGEFGTADARTPWGEAKMQAGQGMSLKVAEDSGDKFESPPLKRTNYREDPTKNKHP